MRRLGLVLAAAAISGCSPSVGYVMDNYNHVPVVDYEHTTGLAYRVFDRPSDEKMMITGSFKAAFGQSLAGGNTKEPAENYTAAAIGWLAKQGRNCKATSTKLLLEPQYEVTYSCS